MSQVYKVVKDLELDNEQHRSGEEIVCRAREGEELINKGFLVLSSRELDPNDKKDAALLAKSDKRAKDKHDEITEKQEEKAAEKESREEAKDEKHAEKLAEVKKLAEEKGEDVSKLEGKTSEELEKESERITGLPNKKPEKETKTKEGK